MIIGVTLQIQRLQVVGALLVPALLLLAGCGTPAGTPGAASRHVFLIVMENKSPDEALQGPFTASLASSYGVAADYRAVSHPSVPNYLALTSGQTWGIQDDSYHALPTKDLGTQLTAVGVTWRAYMDGMIAGCSDSPVPYDPGHNPFAFYGGACPSNVVPFTSFKADLDGNTPMFSWISPDMCHDEHSCDVSVGDEWLRQTVGQIMKSKAWTENGALFITWDEDDGSSDNRVLTMVVTPNGGHHVSNRPYTHYSLLATIEDLMGVGRLGNAARATPMTDLVH